MVFDAARGVVLLLGGTAAPGGGVNLRGDAWEWNGEYWSEVARQEDWPPARNGAGMVYDEARGVVLLFGGLTPGGYNDDTWVWDGHKWKLWRGSGRWPPSRSMLGMAYDAGRRTTVLYGGMDGSGLSDTWEWNGQRWSSKTASKYGPPSSEEPLTFCPIRDAVVLFLGAPEDRLGEVWTWNGSDWSSHLPAGPVPAATSRYALSSDPVRKRVVLFGGLGTDLFVLPDTWEWDGESWSERKPSRAVPTRREGHAAVTDTTRGVVVLFGGLGASLHRDTWEWDGQRWVERQVSGDLPAARTRHAMAFDPIRQRTVLFGGAGDDGVPMNDLWEWDGESWHARPNPDPGPDARADQAMSFDSATGEVLLFGGIGENDVPLGDTWSFNGERWELRMGAASGPGPRSGHAMAVVPSPGGVLLFGGWNRDTTSYLGDTWLWDGQKWGSVAAPEGGPGGRAWHSLTYDPVRDVHLLYGGYDGARRRDTWEWRAGAWTQRPTSVSDPAPRRGHAAAFDTRRRKVMLLSGVGDGDRFDDTWLFDAVPERAAAVQLVVDAGPFGIEPRSITGLRVRASCRSEAAGALRGAQILGWVTRGTGAHPGGVWSQVAVADEDGAVDWALSGGDQALPFVVERPHRLAFQCRPDLDDGDDLELSEVFLGYVEVRLSYRTR